MPHVHQTKQPFFPSRATDEAQRLGKDACLSVLNKMLLIRQFEQRAEVAYQQGKVGGFLHLYIGQEAIQTAALEALGNSHWFATSYRCHALALLLGETPESLMKELFGRADGNAHGRGGSMHLYSSRMLGGFGIVGGQVPIATGAAFSCKYLEKKDTISVCFFGDGAAAQGVFYESLNLASLLSLPCLYVMENNKWSMGTPLSRSLANHEHFSRNIAETYGMKHFRLDGMDFFNCYAGFSAAYAHIRETQRPVLVECLTDRFKGHSVSDPGHYRGKEELKKSMERDPLLLLKNHLLEEKWITAEEYAALEKICREEMLDALKAADEASWPDVTLLGTDIFAKGA